MTAIERREETEKIGERTKEKEMERGRVGTGREGELGDRIRGRAEGEGGTEGHSVAA